MAIYYTSFEICSKIKGRVDKLLGCQGIILAPSHMYLTMLARYNQKIVETASNICGLICLEGNIHVFTSCFNINCK